MAVLKRIVGTFVLDGSVEIIGSRAFHNQSSMKEVILNSKLKEIWSSFNFCYGLTKIEIPSSVEKINTDAFWCSDQLREVVIHKPEGSISGAPWGNSFGLRAIKWQP